MAERAWIDREHKASGAIRRRASRPVPTGNGARMTAPLAVGRHPEIAVFSASDLPAGGIRIRDVLPEPAGIDRASDLDEVRVHVDSASDVVNRRLGSRAFTAGQHVYFGAGEFAPWLRSGRALIAHELMHASQQRQHGLSGMLPVGNPHDRYEVQAAEAGERGSLEPPLRTSGALIQRYLSFEHVKAGSAEKFIGPAYSRYKVKKGETPARIAAANHMIVTELLAPNRDRLRKWHDSKGRRVVGFMAGDTILIPLAGKFGMREPKKGEAEPAQRKVTIGGETMDYGEAIALGDFYEDPKQMLAADPAELKELRRLMAQEGVTPASVGQQDWDAATHQRYMRLNRQNIAHFAPPDKALVAHTGAGIENHKASYEKWHQLAIQTAMTGNLNQAMAINAFADHFLTDAFAAGHLVNKEDIIATVAGSLSTSAQIETFATQVAAEAWTNAAVANTVSQFKGKYKRVFWVRINRASDFGVVLSNVAEDPDGRDLLPNAVAGAVHDRLNTEGVDVQNGWGDSWKVGGDGTLEKTGLALMQKAVAQSQIQVLNAQGEKTEPSTSTYEDVWRYTPRPTATGVKSIRQAVADLTKPGTSDTTRAVAKLVIDNLPFLLRELVRRGKLIFEP